MTHTSVLTSKFLPGVNILEAAAGTGKTYTLIRFVLRHIVENNLTIEQILVISFTTKATAEIKQRLEQLISQFLQQLENQSYQDEEILCYWLQYYPVATIITKLTSALDNYQHASIYTIDQFLQVCLHNPSFGIACSMQRLLDDNQSTIWLKKGYSQWQRVISNNYSSQEAHWLITATSSNYCKFFYQRETYSMAAWHEIYQSPNNKLITYYRAWQEQVSTHYDKIITFIVSPPPCYNLNKSPFIKRNGTHKVAEFIRQCKSNQLVSLSDFLTFSKSLSADYLSQQELCKKGQNFVWQDHELADFFNFSNQSSQFDRYDLEHQYLYQCYQYLVDFMQAEKDKYHCYSYQDILHKLHQFLQNLPSTTAQFNYIHQLYGAALIDEFQDTNRWQMDIFHYLFSQQNKTIHCIGDPKQSIYHFRGADMIGYIYFKQNSKSHQLLDTNYRSSPKMVTAINQFFQQHDDIFWQQKCRYFAIKAGIKSASAGGICLQHILTTQTHLIGIQLVQDIQQVLTMLATRNEKATIAILVATKTQGIHLQKTFQQHGITMTLDHNRYIIDTIEFKAMYAFLFAVWHYHEDSAIYRWLLSPMVAETVAIPQQDTIMHYRRLLAQAKLIWQQQGIAACCNYGMRYWLQSHNQLANYITEDDNNHQSYQFISTVFVRLEQEFQLPAIAIILWCEQVMAGQLKYLSRDDLVLPNQQNNCHAKGTILTMHKSKGLEFDYVFIPYLKTLKTKTKVDFTSFYREDKFIFSYYNNRTLNQRFADDYSHIQQEEKSEAMRLLYVVITRAKRKVYLYVAAPDSNVPKELSYLPFNDWQKCQGVIYQKINEDEVAINLNAQQKKLVDTIIISAPIQKLPLSYQPTYKIPQLSFSAITQQLTNPSQQHSTTTTEQLEPSKELVDWQRWHAGTQLGNMWHQLLELMLTVSSSQWRQMISLKLRLLAPWKTTLLSSDNRSEILQESTQEIIDYGNTLMHKKLLSGAQLIALPAEHIAIEMDFLCYINSFNFDNLTALLVKYKATVPLFNDYYQWLITNTIELDYTASKSLCEGFIDLVYYWQGSYHIIDWKTNYLANYQIQELHHTMCQHHYVLQIIFYSYALDRYLAQRYGNTYNRNQYLGSVEYIFLRGCSEQHLASCQLTNMDWVADLQQIFT